MWSRNLAPRYWPNRFEKLYPHRNLQNMSIAALFITIQTWKEPRHPSNLMNKQIVAYPYNGILFITQNKLSSHRKTQMNLKCILLGERSQYDKAIYIEWFHLYNILEKSQTFYRDNNNSIIFLEFREKEDWIGGP